jgi:hypothetical protein
VPAVRPRFRSCPREGRVPGTVCIICHPPAIAQCLFATSRHVSGVRITGLRTGCHVAAATKTPSCTFCHLSDSAPTYVPHLPTRGRRAQTLMQQRLPLGSRAQTTIFSGRTRGRRARTSTLRQRTRPDWSHEQCNTNQFQTSATPALSMTEGRSSAEAVTRYRPSFLQATCARGIRCPESTTGEAVPSARQIRAVLSIEAVATRSPSGLKAAHTTSLFSWN